ncbi:MAG: LolA family protein [Candidatus Binatia bacterium]
MSRKLVGWSFSLIGFWAGVAVWVHSWTPAFAGETKDADAVADALQKKVNSTAEFVADFRQETEIKTLGKTIKASGKVYFKRPGRMLWRYDEPKGQYVAADGNHLYMYQPEQAQVIKTPLRSAFRSDVPLSFLLGIGNLKRDFQYTLKGSEKGVYLLQLTPKSEIGQVGELILGVDMKEFELQWVRIQDAVGNVTRVRFSSPQRGVEVKDSLFRPNIPQGVEVVELGSLEGP